MSERPHAAFPLRLAPWALGGALVLGAVALAWASNVGGSMVLWGVLGVVISPLLAVALRRAYAFAAKAPAMTGLVLSFAFLTVRASDTTWYEVVGAVYFYLALLWWLYARATSREHALLKDPLDLCLAFFIGWSLLSAVWGLQVGKGADVMADANCILALAIYFPAREQALRKDGGRWLLYAVLLLGLYVAVRNMINYRLLVLSAVAEWQRNARVTTSEVVLLLGATGSLVLHAYAQTWRLRLVSLVGFGVMLTSLILTQTRAFWVDLVVAVGVIALLAPWQKKARTGLGVAATLLVGSAGVYLLLGEELVEMAGNLLTRAATLNTSVLSDLSLMSRIVEARTVLDYVAANPVMGYGIGANYSFYDVIDDATLTRTFVHNGYVGMLFKAGLAGTVPLLVFWAMWIVRGLRMAVRKAEWEVVLTTAMLIALLPSASTAMHVYARDTAFVFALCSGWLAGVYERARRVQRPPAQALDTA